MKKVIPILLFFLSLFAAHLVLSVSSPEYDQAYQEFTQSYHQYQEAHQEYLVAKNKYSTYQTLTTKTQALEATAKMLKLRDESMKNYLTALRLNLSATADTTLSLSYFANMLYLDLEKEITWLNDHQTKFSSAATFADLLKLSSETEEKHPDQETLSYQSLGTILDGQLKEPSQEIKNTLNELEEKIALIREEGKIDTATPERWVMEAKNKHQLSVEKHEEAAAAIKNLKSGATTKDYQKITTLFTESSQYLKETISYLLETISYLRGEKL